MKNRKLPWRSLARAIAIGVFSRGDDAVLESSYDSEDDIPEKYRDLFTKRGEKFELTKVRGIKTAADFDRMENGIKMERSDHKKAKTELAEWQKLGKSPEDVHTELDRIPELEAKVEGGADDEAIEKRIQARVDAAVNPLQRKLEKAETERDEARNDNETLRGEARDGRVRSSLRAAAVAAKMEGDAVDDQVTLHLRTFEETDDGQIVTRDGVGVTPGMEPKAFFEDMRESGNKPYLWGQTSGSGARGDRGQPGDAGNNPWSAQHWNITEQGRIISSNTEKAKRLATRAGHEDPNTARLESATDYDRAKHGQPAKPGGLL